jgi:four helix bundle protein
MRNFRELEVWQRATKLTVAVYRCSAHFPQDERFGLVQQIRRAAASIGANIAEGAAKESDADFSRFLQISLGSACEVENFLLLASELKFVNLDAETDLLAQLMSLKKQLTRFIQFLNNKVSATRRTGQRINFAQ